MRTDEEINTNVFSQLEFTGSSAQAEEVLRWHFPRVAVADYVKLRLQSEEGKITAAELAKLESYELVMQLLEAMHVKAWQLLMNHN